MEWVEVRGDDVAAAEELALDQLGVAPVSYTHLTLPTKA